MRKLTILFALLTLSVGLWAAETQEVSYRYPVYNTDGNPASGIKEWKEGTAIAIVITSSKEKVTWPGEWYVVQGYGIELTKGVECHSNINLILADDAQLIIPTTESCPGIKVSGDNASLTIYGQTKNNGTLRVYGGPESAGIGGGNNGGGSNITINGGIVMATGGSEAAGIGGGSSYNSSTTIQGSNITINAGTVTATGGYLSAGIGGGNRGSGSNITINGGIVKATGANSGSGIGGGYKGGKGFDITINGGVVIAKGGNHAAGIGGGNMGIGYNITISCGTVTATGGTGIAGIGIGEEAVSAAYNIFVTTSYIVKANGYNPPTTVIENDGNDLASDLAGKQYVTVEKGSTTALPETEDSRFKID